MIENNIYIGYYGTNKNFNNFDVSLIQNNKFGRGIYFTNSINEAKEHGKRVIKAKLSIKNPMIIKDSYFANEEIFNEIGIKKSDHLDSKEIHEKIINSGFDGIIVNNVNADEELKYYVVFNPNQIEIEDDNFSEKDLREYYESFKKAFLGENAVENDDSDILMEGIEEIKKYFPKIPEEKFQSLVDLDPTYTGGNNLGKFGKWILTLYNKGLLKDEDFYKVTEYLMVFKNNLKKMPNKDIMSYKSLPDLAKAIQGYENQEDVSNRQQVKNIKKDVKKIKETDKWLVITPLTQEAAQYYGANTKWCTAGKEHNMFDYYNEQGKIYIIINKQDNKKYQFHAESFQFMNELDNPVPPAKIIDDKSILDLIETSLYQYMSSEEYDCWENCPLYGVYPDEYDYYPVCKKDRYDFFRELYDVFSHDEDYKTLDLIEEWWSDEDIDLIKTEISDLPYYDELDEKAKKNGFSSYQEILDSPYFDKEWDKQMKQINEYFIQDLHYACRKLPYKVLDIGHSKNDEEINIYISTKDNQYENYDDFIVNWFMNANTNEYKEVLEEIFDNIYDAEDVVGIMHEFLFDVINRIKNNPDQLSFKFDEDCKFLKNPNNMIVETCLKMNPIRFAFNPMNNDFIITDVSYNPIPLNESVEKYITGILSPNLVEITSNIADDFNDSKEIVENLLGKRFKEIFKNHYEIIL